MRKGFYRPPLTGAPISVAGLHWVGLLVCGHSGPPTVAAMQWWTKRGAHASDHKTVMGLLLARARQQWGRQVRHIWDRGFAGTPWLFQVLETNLRFVVRWPKRYTLLDLWGERRKAWEIARGKRAWATRQLYDPKRKEWRKAGVLAISVTHPEHARPLWLVIARLKGAKEPWYLLTSDTMRRRRWRRLPSAVNLRLTPRKPFTLSHVLLMRISRSAAAAAGFATICRRGTQESINLSSAGGRCRHRGVGKVQFATIREPALPLPPSLAPSRPPTRAGPGVFSARSQPERPHSGQG